MPRVLLAAGSLLAGLLPLSAGALGLGEISLKSALNQPFDAEIPLTGDTAEELAQLRVELASPEVFARFGLDRPGFLNDLAFQVRTDGNRGVVRVTSPRAVSEPFVSLLVEVTWPSGRLLREYTVLLDPPAFVGQEAAPQVASPAAPVAQPAPGSRVTREQPSAPAPEPAPGPALTSGGTGTPGTAPAGQGSATPGSYGPVRANQTLWGIAEEVRPDSSVSMNDMMVAIFRANPEAFAGNINRLRAGAIIRIPAAGEIATLAGADANAEVQRQYDEWRADVGRADAGSAPRLQLVPPAEQPAPAAPGPGPAPGVAQTSPDGLESELAESRRLLELKDQQLKALQERIANLEGRDTGVPAAAPDEEAALERLPDEPETVMPVPDAGLAEEQPGVAPGEVAGEAPAEAPVPARAPSAPVAEPSLLGRIGDLVLNAWFLGAAALVLLGGLLAFRRRSAGEEERDYPLRDLRIGGQATAGAAAPARRDSFIVEEESAGDRTSITPAPRPAPGRTEAEQPLERTISADSGVEIDQADVVAEADFHMAYGLYDQAADLLGKALRNDPSRRDLRLKLLEVYFIWENKGAFLKEAQAFHDLVGGAGNPDWGKVVLLGKQLCPEEALFAGQAGSAPSDSLDFSLEGDGGAGGIDVSFEEGSSGTSVDLEVPGSDHGDGLDFDLGTADAEGTLAATSVATSLAPTVEAPSMDTPTVETPTIESHSIGASTVETPTLESTGLGWSGPDAGGRRTGEAADSTEEINLEDLGLDLTGLDEAAGDLAGSTGIGPAPDFDVGAPTGDGSPSSLLQEAPAEGLGLDATAELPGAGLDEGTLDLPAFGTALEKSGDRAGSQGISSTSDTAEHRALEDTAEQPRTGWRSSSAGAPGEPADLGELPADDIEPTAIVGTGRRRGPEGPTMTEVGTKLDLARAYIDMGDPDGARSILNEVLEEGDGAQRQEARKLLDELAD